MQKINLRPLRLIHLNHDKMRPDSATSSTLEKGAVEHGEEAEQQRELQSSLPETAMSIPEASAAEVAGEAGARQLLKRTPHSYLFNQIYGLWFYISWFLLTIIITHGLSNKEDYGTYAVATTAYNTILYIVAFGLEDVTATYVPHVFAEHGEASAAQFIRRLLAVRIVILLLCVLIVTLCLPALGSLIGLLPIQGSSAIDQGLHNPELLSHVTPIGIYVFGSSVASLLTALCAAFMRMRIVLIVGSATQAVLLLMGFVVLRMGMGVNGLLWLLAIGSLVNALAFAIWLYPILALRGSTYKQPLLPLVKLSISAWLTNLVTGALLKQVSIILLGIFAISLTEIGYFNLSFQLADSANLLLAFGFGGVANSALAAAFVGQNHHRVARSWQALIKIETLLAAPGLVFCLFNAPTIIHALYGSNYEAVGPLFAIFLFFNLLVRLFGTTIHQLALYVVNKAHWVVLMQGISLLIVIVLGILLIPRYGVAGALLADGIAKAITGLLLLFLLLPDLPRQYPLELLRFSLRFIFALVVAALPGLLWHPNQRPLLFLSGLLFIVLCIGLLLWMKPLGMGDIEMLEGVSPRVARYTRWFARKRA